MIFFFTCECSFWVIFIWSHDLSYEKNNFLCGLKWKNESISSNNDCLQLFILQKSLIGFSNIICDWCSQENLSMQPTSSIINVQRMKIQTGKIPFLQVQLLRIIASPEKRKNKLVVFLFQCLLLLLQIIFSFASFFYFIWVLCGQTFSLFLAMLFTMLWLALSFFMFSLCTSHDF